MSAINHLRWYNKAVVRYRYRWIRTQMIAVVLGGAVKVPGQGGGLFVGEAGQGLQSLAQREDQPGHQGQAPQGDGQVPAE